MSIVCKESIPAPLTDLEPMYDISKSYQENCDEGPFFRGSIPGRKRNASSVHFLGFSLNSPIGIAAGPLLNSRWIDVAAQLGFDLLTYKTIRSAPHPSHPLPNVAFVDCDAPLVMENLPPSLSLRDTNPVVMEQLSITNSFGNPTQSLDFLAEDIPKAKECLRSGQLLIVSVVGTPTTDLSIAQDFAQAASFACRCGADVIEANFSCPNVTSSDGTLYQDPIAAEETCDAIRKAIGSTPLIIKVGPLIEEEKLRALLHALSNGGADAVCGINTISMRVEDAQGNPSLSPDRPTSGICGAAIRETALSWTKKAAQIICKDAIDLALMGCGGVVQKEHFQDLINAGADIAMCATGMMWDPYLASKYHTYTEEKNGQ